MAAGISSSEYTGPIESPGMPVSILKKGSRNSSDKKQSRSIVDSPMQVGQKDSKDTTPTELIKNKQAMFWDRLASDQNIFTPDNAEADALDDAVNGENFKRLSVGTTTMVGRSPERPPKAMRDRGSM